MTDLWHLKHRLEACKRTAAANAGKTYLPQTWQAVARDNARKHHERARVWNTLCHDARTGDRWRWVENATRAGLIVEIANATRETTRYTGYFVDEGHDSIHGIVYRVPGGRARREARKRGGEALYLPAVSDAYNDGAARLLWHPTEDLRQAARDADHAAEKSAREDREYNEAWQAGSRWADLGDEIKAARVALRALVKDARTGCADLAKAPAVLDAVRRDITRQWRAFRKAQAERRDLIEASRWVSADAFNEGAGETVLR